jgi:hypothetical protein
MLSVRAAATSTLPSRSEPTHPRPTAETDPHRHSLPGGRGQGSVRRQAKFVVRVDVAEEFRFLVTKLSPYYDR